MSPSVENPGSVPGCDTIDREGGRLDYFLHTITQLNLDHLSDGGVTFTEKETDSREGYGSLAEMRAKIVEFPILCIYLGCVLHVGKLKDTLT